MHHHLARQFPEACPIGLDGPAQPERHAVPVPAGIGKGEPSERTLAEQVGNGEISIDKAREALGMAPLGLPETSVPSAFKVTPENADLFADADVYKSFKKMRKRLGKKVLAGKITVDEARARMGRQFAQKAAEPEEVAEKSAAVTDRHVVQPLTVDLSATSDLFKSAIAEAVTPLLEQQGELLGRLERQDKAIADEREATATKLAEQQRVIDAIADQPDPSTAAFSGLAFQPQVIKSRRPAAVPDQAEYAARAQQMVRRNLQNTYQTHSNPHVREAAGEALANFGVTEVAS
jgi:hypothetical protein